MQDGFGGGVEQEPIAEGLTQPQAALFDEVRQAEAQLPYVSRWYFLNRWRGLAIPVDPGPVDPKAIGPSFRSRLPSALVPRRLQRE